MLKSKIVFILIFVNIFIYAQDYYSFTPRKCVKPIVFNDKLYIFGGIKNQTSLGLTYVNDIWLTGEGDRWVVQKRNFLDPRRSGYSVVVFREKIFVIGGYDEITGRYLSDIHFSEDVLNWKKASFSVEFQGRINSSVVVYKGKLWLFGGTNKDTNFTDVWSSKDGFYWEKVSDSLPYKSINEASVVVFNDKIYILSGGNGVFSTGDGINFELENKGGVVFEKDFFATVVLNGAIFLIAGENINQSLYYKDFSNEVWKSEDGKNWTQISPYPPGGPRIYTGFSIKPARRECGAVVFRNRILVLGGVTDNFDTYLDDVWISAEGNKWLKLR